MSVLYEKKPRTCAVSREGCLAPAGYRSGRGIAYGDRSCRGTCVRCGEAVCANCSRRVCTMKFTSHINGQRKRTTHWERVCYHCKPELTMFVDTGD